jgi:hypothetical protein
MTSKPESNPISPLRGEIPAEVMAKLLAAYQASGHSSTQGCPDFETVIAYALEELFPEKRARVYAHLSECKDCLNLVLDLRSAWAEAEEGKHKIREIIPIRVRARSWLAGLMDGVRGSLCRPVPLPRLIAVALTLVVLAVVGLGVFQHLTAPTRDRLPSIMTNLNPGTTHNHRVNVLDKSSNVYPGAPILARARGALTFLPLLLKSEKGNNFLRLEKKSCEGRKGAS